MNPRQVIHVQGVASPDEAEQLEALGVELIGVRVGERATGRILGSEDARRISARLKRARLCVEPLGGAAALDAKEARWMGARVVQVPWGQEVPRAWRESLAREGLEWALVRVAADEDDDPAWVRARLEEQGGPPPAWMQVEICPSLEEGWRIIRDSNESELDARDLDALAAEFPLLFSLSLSLDDIDEVRRRLRHARGFSFAITDDRGEAPGAHRFTLEQLRVLLERLNSEARA
jgi:hypothetical protein